MGSVPRYIIMGFVGFKVKLPKWEYNHVIMDPVELNYQCMYSSYEPHQFEECYVQKWKKKWFVKRLETYAMEKKDENKGWFKTFSEREYRMWKVWRELEVDRQWEEGEKGIRWPWFCFVSFLLILYIGFIQVCQVF